MQPSDASFVSPPPRWRGPPAIRFRIAGAGCWILAVLLLFPVLNRLSGARLPENYLSRIIVLHASPGISADTLTGFFFPDAGILGIIGAAGFLLYPELRRANRLWTPIGLCIAGLGMALYLATGEIGRSGAMAAGVALSAVMVRSAEAWRKPAPMGVLANALLLIGDVGLAFSRSIVFAAIMSAGYSLLLVWSFRMGWILLRMAPVHTTRP